MNTLYSMFEEVARRYPDFPAVVANDRTLAYWKLFIATQELAQDLQRLGVRHGSRVALLLPNGARFVSAFFAVARLGGVIVPLNPSYKEPEIVTILKDGEVSTVLTGEEFNHVAQGAASYNQRVVVVTEPAEVTATAQQSFASQDDAVVSPEYPLIHMYSSGSTGRPKRIVRTHFQLLYETERLIGALMLSPADRVIGVAPFTHINGLMRSMVASILSGATLVPLVQFERRLVAQTIEAHRITIFIGVPFMFAMLADSRWPSPVDFSSLRYCLSASAPLRVEASRKFFERYSIFVCQLYGTTETGTISLNLSPKEGRSLDSVGTPLDGIRVEVFSENRRLLSAGEEGEIGIKSPAATLEYPGLPEQTRESFWNGYFFPGDIGCKDAEGNIYLVGRKSLFINRAGYKVNPLEVEELVEQHPKVKEAAVIGVDTPYGDQKIKAVVVPSEPLEEFEVVEFCRSKVADFKVPSIVEFRKELPKSPTGKILRRSL